MQFHEELSGQLRIAGHILHFGAQIGAWSRRYFVGMDFMVTIGPTMPNPTEGRPQLAGWCTVCLLQVIYCRDPVAVKEEELVHIRSLRDRRRFCWRRRPIYVSDSLHR